MFRTRPVIAILSLGLCLLVETVAVTAGDLVQALSGAPRYQLSPPKEETDRFGRNVLVIDYRKTQSGPGSVGLRARSSRGPVTVSAFIPSFQETGTLRLQNLFGRRDSIGDVEFYLTQPLRISPSKSLDMLVSNRVRVGNPGSLPAPRAITAEEKRQSKSFQDILANDDARKPSKSYPVSVKPEAGMVFVPNTAMVKKGVELSACYNDQWHPVRVLSENPDGTINISWDTFGSGFRYAMSRGEVTIQQSLLATLDKHPASKYPVVQPNWAAEDSAQRSPSTTASSPASVADKRLKRYRVSIPVPPDSQTIPNDATLKPGTRLQACYASKWNPITFLAHASDGTLTVRWDDYGPAFDCRMVREELIIKRSELREQMGTGSGAEMRLFTDVTGRFQVQARVVSSDAASVTLLTEAGKEVKLPLTKLSEKDQQYLREWNAAENPFQ
ncbi:MAG: SHD1 domain-containing protein [Planctomycetota bacterium]